MCYFRNFFRKNGYPSWFFDQFFKKFDDRDKLVTQTQNTNFSLLVKSNIMLKNVTNLLIISFVSLGRILMRTCQCSPTIPLYIFK